MVCGIVAGTSEYKIEKRTVVRAYMVLELFEYIHLFGLAVNETRRKSCSVSEQNRKLVYIAKLTDDNLVNDYAFLSSEFLWVNFAGSTSCS